MATFLLVLLCIAVCLLAGYAPTLLLVDPDRRWPRPVAFPVVGLASYIVASHFLAAWGLAGRTISWICLVFFAVLALVVPRGRRLTRPEIVASLPPLAVCLGGLLFAAWPLLYEGHHSYLGFSNSDAAFNIAVYEDLANHAYAQPSGDFPPYWPSAQFAHVFGAGYLGVLVAFLTGAPLLKLHEVIGAGLVFVAPASVFLFCVHSLKTTTRTALATMSISATSSLVCYTFYLQSLGVLALLGLAPGVLAFWAAALESGETRPVLLTGLLFTGASFGYYASFPVLAMLLGWPAVVALLQRTVRWWELARATLLVVAVPLLTFPTLTGMIVRRSVVEAGSTRLEASLNGPEVLLSFTFALTEQLLPFFWGLSIPPLSPTAFAAPASGFFVVLVLAALLWVVLLLLLVRPGAPWPLAVRAQVAALLAAVAYFLYRRNAYGVFKLVAWVNPVVLPCFVCGLLALATRRWRRLRFRPGWLLLPLVGLNIFWSLHLGARTLERSGIPGRNMAGGTAGDLDGLRSLAGVVPPDSRLLVALPDAVLQRWALTYLRRPKLSVVPYLSLSPDEPDSDEERAARDASSASYLLTWAGQDNIEVPHQRSPPRWRNRRFRLFALPEVHNLVVAGRGWYPVERNPGSSYRWQHQFRWLRTAGEVLLVKPTRDRLRLRLILVSGYGRNEPEQWITLSSNGATLDQFGIAGFGSGVVTEPFQADGFLARLTLSLPDNARPLPRP